MLKYNIFLEESSREARYTWFLEVARRGRKSGMFGDNAFTCMGM
jgi:hypothetical protein